MTTYTTRPSPTHDGYTDIFKGRRRCVGCPADEAEAMIARFITNDRERHERLIERLEALDPDLVIADGEVYSIGRADDDPKGYGGARFLVAFFDGRAIETDSLWSLGGIDPEWRLRLPNNATLTAVPVRLP